MNIKERLRNGETRHYQTTESAESGRFEDYATFEKTSPAPAIQLEAADHIEALERRIAELEPLAAQGQSDVEQAAMYRYACEHLSPQQMSDIWYAADEESDIDAAIRAAMQKESQCSVIKEKP